MKQNLSRKTNSIMLPWMRLSIGIILALISLFLIVSIYLSNNYKFGFYLIPAVMFLISLRMFITHNDFRRKFNELNEDKVIAIPVNTDGELQDSSSVNSFRKTDFQQPFTIYESDTIFIYIISLILLFAGGYGFIYLRSLKYKEFTIVFPWAGLFVYLTLIGAILWVVLAQKLIFISKRSVLLSIFIVLIWILMIIMNFCISPDTTLCNAITIGTLLLNYFVIVIII